MSDRNDPITMAMLFNARMVLDLLWALKHIPTTEPVLRELHMRRLESPALDSCAKEVGL